MTQLNKCSAKRLRSGLIFCASAAVLIAMLVATQSCKKEQPSPELEGGKLDQSVAAQKKINRYFHSVVVPKVKDCWDKVQGEGTIEMVYTYEADAEGGWAFKSLEVGDTTLQKGQDAIALACMEQAVAATSFPRDASDRGESYQINWDWPVPLPPDTAQLAARMFGSSGGEGTGCDGHGAKAKCVTCAGRPQSCIYVCVGFNTCELAATSPGGFDSICTEGGKCASGGLFGVVGGIMIF